MWQRIRFLWTRVGKMDFSALWDAVGTVSLRSGTPLLRICADMAWCALKYGAGYTDYLLFHMEKVPSRLRGTYMTRGISNHYVAQLNEAAYRTCFSEKDRFYTLFGKDMGRECLCLSRTEPEEFAAFLRGKESFFAKPLSGSGGQGVKKYYTAQISDFQVLYHKLKSSGRLLVEECLDQHPQLERLYSGSVNTCRIVTLLSHEKVFVVAAFLRLGSHGAVDNFHSGGMVTRINPATGRVLFHPVDRKGRIYRLHPVTGAEIRGFIIPCWEDCLRLAERSALVVPQVRYVGWDVAVTPQGPVLMEGNEFPGHDLYQLPALTPDKTGILPQFEKLLAQETECGGKIGDTSSKVSLQLPR